MKSNIVYESPDGGRTIFTRKVGEIERHLHYKDPELEREQKINKRWLNLKEAVFMADSDVSLDDAIKRVEILHVLKKNN